MGKVKKVMAGQSFFVDTNGDRKAEIASTDTSISRSWDSGIPPEPGRKSLT